jgi:hypothetical protein
MHENLKQLSTRSRQVIAKGSTHYIQIDRPDLLEREVPPFIEQVRGASPVPTNYVDNSRMTHRFTPPEPVRTYHTWTAAKRPKIRVVGG